MAQNQSPVSPETKMRKANHIALQACVTREHALNILLVKEDRQNLGSKVLYQGKTNPNQPKSNSTH